MLMNESILSSVCPDDQMFLNTLGIQMVLAALLLGQALKTGMLYNPPSFCCLVHLHMHASLPHPVLMHLPRHLPPPHRRPAQSSTAPCRSAAGTHRTLDPALSAPPAETDEMQSRFCTACSGAVQGWLQPPLRHIWQVSLC